MISCYTTLFNLNIFSFNIDEIMSNWLYYFQEIIVATDKKEEEAVKELFKNYNHAVKVVSQVVNFSDERWDGKLKNFALKNCSNEIVFQLDADERLSGSKDNLQQCESLIKKNKSPCSLMIQNIDLYYDLDHYRSVGAKWYIHTKTGSNRGVVNFAKINDFNFDPEKSDGCELIDNNGNLIESLGVVPIEMLTIFHLGHLDFKNRAKLNKLFWRDIWTNRKSIAKNTKTEAEDVLVSTIDMESREKFKHHLQHPLWPTI